MIKEYRMTLFVIRRTPLAMVGLILMIIVSGIAIFGPLLTPYNPITSNLTNALLPPSAAHLFGTDGLGRDVLSRVVWGSRTSLSLGIYSAFFSCVIGLVIGLYAGYKGGIVDDIIMRITDIFFALPRLVLAIAVVAFLRPSLLNVMTAVVFVSWPTYARLSRGSTLSVKTETYIEAARSLGERDTSIIFRYVLPNVIAPILVNATLDVANLILIGSGLSFLGLGAQPPTAEWGLDIASGRMYLLGAWWISTFPGIALLLSVLGFNLFGDGLRDALDPKLRAQIEK
jgi:peptide/nickel transport system permease protein